MKLLMLDEFVDNVKPIKIVYSSELLNQDYEKFINNVKIDTMHYTRTVDEIIKISLEKHESTPVTIRDNLFRVKHNCKKGILRIPLFKDGVYTTTVIGIIPSCSTPRVLYHVSDGNKDFILYGTVSRKETTIRVANVTKPKIFNITTAFVFDDYYGELINFILNTLQEAYIKEGNFAFPTLMENYQGLEVEHKVCENMNCDVILLTSIEKNIMVSGLYESIIHSKRIDRVQEKSYTAITETILVAPVINNVSNIKVNIDYINNMINITKHNTTQSIKVNNIENIESLLLTVEKLLSK